MKVLRILKKIDLKPGWPTFFGNENDISTDEKVFHAIFISEKIVFSFNKKSFSIVQLKILLKILKNSSYKKLHKENDGKY